MAGRVVFSYTKLVSWMMCHSLINLLRSKLWVKFIHCVISCQYYLEALCTRIRTTTFKTPYPIPHSSVIFQLSPQVASLQNESNRYKCRHFLISLRTPNVTSCTSCTLCIPVENWAANFAGLLQTRHHWKKPSGKSSSVSESFKSSLQFLWNFFPESSASEKRFSKLLPNSVLLI